MFYVCKSSRRNPRRCMVTNQQREKNYEKNVIVGQSGGPTAVINASLAGVYKTAKDMGADTIYGMRYGIQGLLEKKIVDLGKRSATTWMWNF